MYYYEKCIIKGTIPYMERNVLMKVNYANSLSDYNTAHK